MPLAWSSVVCPITQSTVRLMIDADRHQPCLTPAITLTLVLYVSGPRGLRGGMHLMPLAWSSVVCPITQSTVRLMIDADRHQPCLTPVITLKLVLYVSGPRGLRGGCI